MTNHLTEMNFKYYFSFLIFLIAFGSASAQETNKKLITAEFNNTPFESVVKKIESQTGYHFYYDVDDVDSLTVTLSVKNANVNSLLEQIFNGTSLSFVIDASDNIFISNGFTLSSQLGTGIVKGKKTNENKINRDKIKSSEEVNKGMLPVFVDNKLYEIGIKTNTAPKGTVNIAGYVRQVETGEVISGALVFIEKPRIQVSTDQFGYYSINLPAGRHVLNLEAPGRFDTKRQIMLYSDGSLDIDMQEKIIQLKEVRVELGKVKNITSTTMGSNRLDMTSIKQVATALGEVDVLRAVLSLPGVKSVGEAATGLNVRGGATDQNLILFNGSTIFNPSHLFGFFSAFDADVVKDVTLYKSSIPASYGGRISSVLDLTSLDGNDKKISGSAGIGALTGKLTLEGPIIKDKTTFILGARSTYSNWIFNVLPEEYRKSKADFKDVTLHIRHKADAKNTIYLNGYMSGDKFTLNSDTSYRYQNKNFNAQWKHIYNNRLYSVITAGWDHYDYKSADQKSATGAYELSYALDQFKLNAEFSHFLSNKHKLSYGLNTTYMKIQSGIFEPFGKSSLVVPDKVPAEQGVESALYLSDQYTISPDLVLEGGVRFSMFNYLGPQEVRNYAPGQPRQESTLIGVEKFGNGKIIKTYMAPEIRFSARYTLTPTSSVKASFNTLQQYIHMLSNTTAISPTDIWKLSDAHIKPQQGKQVSIGFYKNFKSNTIETSVELYYKWIDNYLDYKSGATLVMNHHIETDVFATKGKSYGVEVLIKKATGKLNGWLSYNYSRSLIKQNDPLAGEKINNGNYYPSNFDQPHSATLIGNYRISHRFSISLNATYSTGRPITLPIGVYNYAGSPRLLYSDRNGYRIPDYFRADFSVNIEGNHKVNQLTHNSWTIGVYNLTARKNAYSIYFVSEDGKVKGYKLSIFGTAIPFITYNIRF